MVNDPMELLLIEDDVEECNNFKKLEKQRKDIKFVGITDSDIEGLQYVKTYRPEGIILDLELNKGRGNSTGFTFLEELKKLDIPTMPKIVVNTNVCSDSVYEYLHSNGVDLIFYKKQANYSYENVINTLLLLRGYKATSKNNIGLDMKIDEGKTNIISQKINKELDLIGISTHLQGRKYLHDAIYYIIENGTDIKTTVIQHLVSIYKRSSSTISRAMQNAILHAWRISSLEDLTTYYTAKINYETGVPTPTEFIYYYADKIKKEI